MGSPKALLTAPNGRPFVAAIVRALIAADVRDVVIVTGADHDSIVDAIDRDDPPIRPRFARNLDPARGQLSSLWVGMDAAVRDDAAALLVTLVDVPLIDHAADTRVIQAWAKTR